MNMAYTKQFNPNIEPITYLPTLKKNPYVNKYWTELQTFFHE